MFPKLFEFIRQKQEPPQTEPCGKHQYKGRENPADTADIELDKAESVSLQIAQDDGWDQEAGDDKEDIHAEKATRYPIGKSMKTNDW